MTKSMVLTRRRWLKRMGQIARDTSALAAAPRAAAQTAIKGAGTVASARRGAGGAAVALGAARRGGPEVSGVSARRQHGATEEREVQEASGNRPVLSWNGKGIPRF